MSSRKLCKCPKCNRYTLMEKCKKCGVPTINPHPSRFSLDDPFLEYKVKAFLETFGKSIGK
ncbi:MAG: nucleolar RNA-binding Nop10p family protein [Thermoproteota archaeon]